MERAQVTSEKVIITLRDRALDLQVPWQANKYAGDNTLPDGVEGVAGDLKGKPKPRCLGVVKNVPAPCVNTSKPIYQVNDGPVASVDGVYDKGFTLGASPYGFDLVAHGLGAFRGRALIVVGSDMYAAGKDSEGGAPNPVIMHSDDAGATFTDITGTYGGSTVEGLAENAGTLVAVGFGATGGVIETSADGGATWVSRSLPASWAGVQQCVSVRWHANLSLFLITGSAGGIATSPTGATWTARTSGTAEPLNDSASNDTLSIVCGDNGVLLESTDAATWSDASNGLPATSSYKAVTYDSVGERWYAGDNNGTSGVIYQAITPGEWTERATALTPGVFEIHTESGWIVAGAVASVRGVVVSRDGALWETAPVDADAVDDEMVAGFGLAIFGGRWWMVGNDSSDIGLYATPAPRAYADLDELLDDANAPDPGSYGYCLNEGLIRLGSPPVGLITADVTQGEAAADRTAAQLFTRVLTDPFNGVLIPFNDDDIAALDTANDAECGIWTDGEVSHFEVADALARSVGACWWVDKIGCVRIKQFTAPSGTAVLSLTANQIIRLERVQPADSGRGLPPWRSIVRYARNYVTQDTDLAGGVTDARRAALRKEWREATAEDGTVQDAHPLAPEVIEDSLLADASEAAAEATRRQTLRGTERDVFEMIVELDDDTAALEPGDVIDVTHSRFSLSGGESLRLIGVEPDPKNKRMKLVAWM